MRRLASTVTMAQVSHGLGLLFLVPLGDMLERRRLILTLMLLAACGMLLSGLSGVAGSFALLAAGTLMAGVFSGSPRRFWCPWLPPLPHREPAAAQWALS